MVTYNYNIKVSPEIKEPQTTIKTESFRDKITAGNKEKWTLHLAIDGKPVSHGAIINGNSRLSYKLFTLHQQ